MLVDQRMVADPIFPIFPKRIDGIIKSIQKGKIPKAQLKAERFQNALKAKVTKLLPKKPKPQRLTNADAEVLIGMLETLLNNLEK